MPAPRSPRIGCANALSAVSSSPQPLACKEPDPSGRRTGRGNFLFPGEIPQSAGNATRSLRRCFVGTILQRKWESSDLANFSRLVLLESSQGIILAAEVALPFVRWPDSSHCPVPLSPRPSQSYKQACPQASSWQCPIFPQEYPGVWFVSKLPSFKGSTADQIQVT